VLTCRFPERELPLTPHPSFREGGEDRKLLGELAEHSAKVALDRLRAWTPPGWRRGRSPGRKLLCHRFLNRLSVGEIEGTAAARSEKIPLVQRQGVSEGGNLDEPLDPIRIRGSEAQPIPPATDHFPERADGETTFVFGKGLVVPGEVPHAGRFALAADPD
jgi:hypothetical protein